MAIQSTNLTRRPATDVSAWSLDGTDLLTELHDASVKLDAKTEDVGGVAEDWEYHIALKYHAEITANMYVSGNAFAVQLGRRVLLIYSTGGDTYTGFFVLTSVDHTAPKDGVQMQKLTFKPQGKPTVDGV